MFGVCLCVVGWVGVGVLLPHQVDEALASHQHGRTPASQPRADLQQQQQQRQQHRRHEQHVHGAGDDEALKRRWLAVLPRRWWSKPRRRPRPPGSPPLRNQHSTTPPMRTTREFSTPRSLPACLPLITVSEVLGDDGAVGGEEGPGAALDRLEHRPHAQAHGRAAHLQPHTTPHTRRERRRHTRLAQRWATQPRRRRRCNGPLP